MKFADVPRISAAAAFQDWQSGKALLVDVRSRSKITREPRTIPGVMRVDPRQLRLEPEVLPGDRRLILFCS